MRIFLTILQHGSLIVLGTLTPVSERKRGIASLATPSLVNVGSPLVVRDFSLVPLRRELATRTDQTKKNDTWKSRQGVEGSLEIVSGSIRFSLPFLLRSPRIEDPRGSFVESNFVDSMEKRIRCIFIRKTLIERTFI